MLVKIVLVRPRNPENLGAVARAMKNFGLSNWAIVDPRTLDFHAARRVAIHSEELLDRPQICSSLNEAVAGSVWVVGTSSRKTRGKRKFSPAQVADRVVELGRSGETAIVFGDERSGLSCADIECCHDLSAIPSDPAQPSLNLAQAVLLYCYQLKMAAMNAKSESRERTDIENQAAAVHSELEMIAEAARSALRACQFLAGPERHAIDDLLATLRRSALTKREMRLWLAAFKSLEKHAISAPK